MDGNHSGLSRLGDAMTALNVRYVTFQTTLKKYARPMRAADRRRIGLASAATRAWGVAGARGRQIFERAARAGIESFIAVKLTRLAAGIANG
jgi:hypothetical protein